MSAKGYYCSTAGFRRLGQVGWQATQSASCTLGECIWAGGWFHPWIIPLGAYFTFCKRVVPLTLKQISLFIHVKKDEIL